MYNHKDETGKSSERGPEIEREIAGPILQLKDKWPHLYDCIDLSRVSESNSMMITELALRAFDFTSISNGGRGELYRRAQQDPLVRGVGIRQLFEFVSPDQNLYQLTPEHKILDVLGGDGVVARAINHLLPASSMPNILTSDLSEDMVAAAQAYGLFAVRQSAQNLLLKDKSIDGVIIAYGTHHIPLDHRLRVCQEALRVLKPGGRVVLHDFEAGSPISCWFSEVVDPYSLTGHRFQHFTAEEIRNYLLDAGFVDIKVEYMYDPFIIYSDSAEQVKCGLAQYLLDMYGLMILVNEHGKENSLEIIYELACQYLEYDYQNMMVDEHFGMARIHIGKDNDQLVY